MGVLADDGQVRGINMFITSAPEVEFVPSWMSLWLKSALPLDPCTVRPLGWKGHRHGLRRPWIHRANVGAAVDER